MRTYEETLKYARDKDVSASPSEALSRALPFDEWRKHQEYVFQLDLPKEKRRHLDAPPAQSVECAKVVEAGFFKRIF